MGVKVKQKTDFTSGGIFVKMLLFVLPIIVSNVLQALYNAADMMVVSLSHEPNAVGAIGTTSSFLSLVVNLFIGFSVGTNVVVARHIGARDSARTQSAVHTSLLMALGFGVLAGAIGLFLSRPILAAMGNSGSLLELAVTYSIIYFCGVPFLSLTNYLSAIFRAKGNAKLPLFVLAVSGLINVGLNCLFVVGFHLSVEGVAWATVISNVFSAAVMLIILHSESDETRFRFRKLKFDKTEFGAIVRIGLPAGIQSALFSISNMLIQSSVVSVNNAMCPEGSDFQPIVKGNAAASTLEHFAYIALNAVAQGAITFTGQNVGADKPERVRGVMGCSVLLTLLVGTIVSCALVLLRQPLLALYGVAPSADALENLAYEAANIRILIIGSMYVICGIMEDFSGVLRGLGKSFVSMLISLIGSCAFRVLWVLVVFPMVGGLQIIYYSYPISWVITAATLILFSVGLSNKLIKEKRKREQGEK